MESARLATRADIEAIEAINDRRRSEMAPERGGPMYLAREASTVPVGPGLAAAVDATDAVVIVGCYDEVIFGYGLATFEDLQDGTKVAVLSHFMVDAEARGSGIGEAMMNLMVEQAETAGCRGIDSVALPGDRETKNFFESFGLKARMLTVHRAFAQREPDDPGERATA